MSKVSTVGDLIPLEKLLEVAKCKSCFSCRYAFEKVVPPIRRHWTTKAGKKSKHTRLFLNIVEGCEKGNDRTKGVCPEFEFSERALEMIEYYEDLIKRGCKSQLDVFCIGDERKIMKGVLSGEGR